MDRKRGNPEGWARFRRYCRARRDRVEMEALLDEARAALDEKMSEARAA